MDELLQKVKEVLESADPDIRVEEVCVDALIDRVDEPFLIRERTDKELADYDVGFRAGEDGKEPDDTGSLAWYRGWAEGQDWLCVMLRRHGLYKSQCAISTDRA
jgi:hypothetical protein